MEVSKTNEQYQINDTYTVDEIVHSLTGSATKGSDSISIWITVDGVGSVSYGHSSNTSLNVEYYNNETTVSFKDFLNDMYDKIWEVIEFVNE